MKKILQSLFVVMLMPFMHAQIYNFSLLSSPYVALTASTSVTNGTVWTSWSGISATANIGFNFVANGNLNTNALHFDTNFVPTVVFSNQPNPNTGFIFAPIIADTADRGFVSGTSQSNISYKTEGNVGSRIFKLEWSNMGFYNEIISDNVSSDFINIQLWLYEGSNIIEYRFGASNISNPAQSFDGDPGFGCGLYPQFDFNTGEIIGSAYALSGNGSSPTFAYTPNYEVYVTSAPASGTVYRFAPSALSTNETNTSTAAEIFPTIVDDSFNIKPRSGSKIKSVTVFDMSGRMIINTKKTDRISMSGVAKGIYNIVVETDSGNTSSRIIKR